jgi:hypothetical protein
MNRDTSADAFEALEKGVNDNYDTTKPNTNDNITISNLRLLKKKITDAQCDDIMFNVEDETDDGSQERLTRIFLNMFNKFRGYNSNDIPLAILLEKTIDQKGKFEEFKKLIDSELGFNWETDSAQVASFQLESVLEIAKKVCPDLDIVSLHSKLSNPDSYKVGINAVLIPEFKEYLKGKDKDYRLLFLVDEVSQYVGSNKEILLNFQNIIEILFYGKKPYSLLKLKSKDILLGNIIYIEDNNYYYYYNENLIIRNTDKNLFDEKISVFTSEKFIGNTILRELTEIVFHPNRLLKLCDEYNIGFDELMDSY